MKYLLNPYMLALTIIVCEIFFNLTVSELLNLKPGENNISSLLIFFLAGTLIVRASKEKMPRLYNIKVISTYFMLVSLISALALLYEEDVTIATVLVLVVVFTVFGFISYFSFIWGQSIGLKTIEKETALTESKKQSTE